MSTNYTVLDASNHTSIIDYNSVSKNIDGVLIRAGYRGYGTYGTIITDELFEAHYAGFKDKIPVGVYFFSQAISDQEAVEEATYLYRLIRNKDIKFPIYIDINYSSSPTKTGRADNLTADQRASIINNFCSTLEGLGYRTGYRIPDEWINTEVNTTVLSEDYSRILINYSSDPTSVYDAWQYTKTAKIDTITTNVELMKFVKDVAGWGTESEVIDISNLDIQIEYESTIYDGTDKYPEVTIQDLVVDRDYLISYEDNINAGTASIILEGINNYKGNVIKYFTIEKADINNFDFGIVSEIEYTGSEINPPVYSSISLGTDYTVSYSNNINVGTGKATIKGINNYTGTKELTFEIIARNINNTSINIEGDRFGFIDDPIESEVTIDGLVVDRDYTVEYKDNIDVGRATIIISGIGNYTSVAYRYFDIVYNDLSYATINVEYSTVIYNGSEFKPKVTIDKFTEGVDFIVDYFNNINVGTATIRVTGIGECFGTKRAYFTIKKASILEMKMVLKESYVYLGKPIQAIPEIEGLKYGTDFKCTYENNTNVGTATIKATGINNYSGAINGTFTIRYGKIEECIAKWGEASLKTIYRVGLDGPFELYIDNNKLEENRDYIIYSTIRTEFEDFTMVTLSVEGIGGIIGSDTYRFRVIDKEPDTPIDYTDDGVYNFGDVDLQDETAEGDYNFKDLDEPDDYTDIPDNTNIDFDELAGGLRLAEYDSDDGTDVKENGTSDLDDTPVVKNNDNGKYNFGDIDLQDETAVGDYDFGDLDEGVDEDNVAEGDYDFNVFAEEDDEGEIPFEYYIKEGTEYILNDTPLYANHCSKAAFDIRSGSYLIYKSNIANNRIRVTKSNSAINNPVRAAGWVNIVDLIALIELSAGNWVTVTGDIYEFPNGNGYRIERSDDKMYVSKMVDDTFEYRYGLSTDINTPILGYAKKEQLKIIYDTK